MATQTLNPTKVTLGADGCWLWTGATMPNGYGKVKAGLAHRVSYEAAKGPIPAGLEIDHLCRVRNCVNPDHLEAVTRKENVRRSEPCQRTHCPQGHAYSDENTLVKNGCRNCRECHRARERARYQEKNSCPK